MCLFVKIIIRFFKASCLRKILNLAEFLLLITLVCVKSVFHFNI